MGRTKRHHTVPQLYLRRFSDNGKQVCVRLNHDQIKRIGIRDICVKELFYDIDICSVSVPNDLIETHFLANYAEKELCKHLGTLDNFNKYSNFCSITDKTEVAKSICIQYYRGQLFRRESQIFGDFRVAMLAKLFLGKDLNIHEKPKRNNAFSLEHAMETFMNEPYITSKAKALAHGHWKIIHSDHLHFITSDNPIVSIKFVQDSTKYKPNKVDIGTEQRIVLFSLSPRDCLIISVGFETVSNSEEENYIYKIENIDDDTIKAINLMQQFNAESTIIGLDEQDLK